MVFFAFSGVEARDGPGTERLMLGGEMQARARGLQPWIMARRRRAHSQRFCNVRAASALSVFSFGVVSEYHFTLFSRRDKRFFGDAAELGKGLFKLERLGQKQYVPLC